MIRTKGEAGSGNIVEAVRHMRAIVSGIRRLNRALAGGADDRGQESRRALRSGALGGPGRQAAGAELLGGRHRHPGRCRADDAARRRGVFVGSGIFKSSDPAKRAKAIVQATTHFKDPAVLVRVSEDLGEAMAGIETSKLAEKDLMQTRGW